MIAWEAAAGPTVHRQGSRCARPAPPASLCAIALTLQAKGYCASRGWEIVADYVEPGASGTRVGSAPAR